MGCPKLTYQTNLKPVHNAQVAGVPREEKVSRQNLKKGVETGNYYYGASSRRDWVQASQRRRGATARPSPAFWREYYDPKVSVWLSVDPLAHKYPHITPYNFVENNPIRLVDPTGLGPDCPDCPEGSIEPVTVTAEKLPLPGPVKEEGSRKMGPPAPPKSAGGGASDQSNTNNQNMTKDGDIGILIYGNGTGGTTPWTSGNDRRVIGSVDANDPAISAAFGLAGKAGSRKQVNALKGLASALAGIIRVFYGSDSGGSGGDETNAGVMGPPAPSASSSSPSTTQQASNDTSIGIGTSGLNGFWTGRVVKISKDKIDSLKSTLKSNEKLYAN